MINGIISAPSQYSLRPQRLRRLHAQTAPCRAGGGEKAHDQHERRGRGNEQHSGAAH